jgi:hypothetical protein
MSERSEGIIVIVVSDNQLRLELVKDVDGAADIIIAPDNPRWGVMMDLFGDELRIGPIVCESNADVNKLVVRISKKPDIQTVVDNLMDDCELLRPLRVDLHNPDIDKPMKCFSKILLHHQLNQHPNRPGKQPRRPK